MSLRDRAPFSKSRAERKGIPKRKVARILTCLPVHYHTLQSQLPLMSSSSCVPSLNRIQELSDSMGVNRAEQTCLSDVFEIGQTSGFPSAATLHGTRDMGDLI